MDKKLVTAFAESHALSVRQTEVLLSMVLKNNSTSQDIARHIGCSESTVHVHLSRIFAKAGCRNRIEVITKLMAFQEAQTSGMPPSRPLSVMTVDDDIQFMQQLIELMELGTASRVNCIRCIHGHEALMHLSRTKKGDESFVRPDLILLDLQMPYLDGFSTLERIKSDTELRSIPVVVFSSHSSQDDINRTYALGANSFVIKPKDAENLQKIVRLLIQYWGFYGTGPVPA